MEQIIAAIIGAVVTGLIAFIAYLYQQRSGNRVIVKMISQTPQITFEDSVQQKLEIIYNGRKVKNLVLTQFVIFNEGSKIVKPLKLTVGVKPKSGFKTTVDLKITDKDLQSLIYNFTYAELNVSDPQEITTSKMDSETGTFEIERPYLNPQKKYTEEEIKVSVFSDVVLDFSVSGGGEDWAIKLVKAREETTKRLLFFWAVLSLVIAVSASIISLIFSNSYINLPGIGILTIILAFTGAMVVILNIIKVYISKEIK